MIDWGIAIKLLRSFSQSFISYNLEFVAHREANEYFMLHDCENELDVKCKVLEWFSRGAHKTQPFGERKTKEFHKFMLDGINNFFETKFDYNDMDLIYTRLGNACNHQKTIDFVNSGYDISILEKDGDNNAQ